MSDWSNMPVSWDTIFCRTLKTSIKPGEWVSIKLLKKEVARSERVEFYRSNDAFSLSKLRHQNICQIMTIGHKGNAIFIISEFSDGGNLWSLITTNGAISIDTAIAYAIQISDGLSYLHCNQTPFYHGRLKLENILLFNGVLKISDFGFHEARKMTQGGNHIGDAYEYYPPEIFCLREYTTSGDIYSLGLVIWSMIHGRKPYDGKKLRYLIIEKLKSSCPTLEASCPKKLAQLIKDCCSYEPAHRPNIKQTLAKLHDIRKNHGPLVWQMDKSLAFVHVMNSQQLVQYLGAFSLSPAFLITIMDERISGSEFLQLTCEELVNHPFNLSESDIKLFVILKENIKASKV